MSRREKTSVASTQKASEWTAAHAAAVHGTRCPCRPKLTITSASG